YLISDVATDLASYASSIETDPARLAQIQDRRAALAALVRKYGDAAAEAGSGEVSGSGVDAVLEWARSGSLRLLELDGDDERVAALSKEKEALLAELGELAAGITAARRDAAARFADDVGHELAALAMPHARIVVDVRERATLGPTGAEEVEILFSAYHGAVLRSLDKGASGDQVSRLRLVIDVVFDAAVPVPTFAFDGLDE